MTRLITRPILLSSSQSNFPPAAAPPPVELVSTAESKFILILAALLCGLICLVGLAAMVRCACVREEGMTSSRNTAAANKGLKKKVLKALPKYTYSRSMKDNDNNDDDDDDVVVEFVGSSAECPICLGEFVEGDQIRVLPQCGHGFHVQCIDTWLGSHSSCPSCRQILVVASRCQKCGHGLSNKNSNSFLP